ncbi:MAG: universal stress protein, partial [Paracoccaceae bacterium]
MPRPVRKILCPVNLRHAAVQRDAYEEAAEMAQRRGAELIVTTIAPEMERNLNIYDSEKYWTEELRKFLIAHPITGVSPRAVVRKGAVHRQIVKLAEDEKVDLIVMEAAN